MDWRACLLLLLHGGLAGLLGLLSGLLSFLE
jgi:hypothetical protein